MTPLRSLIVGVSIATATLTFALRPAWADDPWMWVILTGGYLPLSIWAALDLRRRGKLGELLRPRAGDVSLGILLGLALAAGGFAAVRVLAPAGTPQHEWLFRVYAQVGNLQAPGLPLALLVALVVMEELVWRGWVLEVLAERFGTRLAMPLSAVAYGLAHASTMITLGGAAAGPNPLLVLAALGAGLCWAFAVTHLRRLWPVCISHLVFTYFMAAPLPRWF